MAPKTLSVERISDHEHFENKVIPKEDEVKIIYVYKNFLIFGYWHLAALYGTYLAFTSAKLATIVFIFFLYVVAEVGITGGAHRLWSHRTYKAKLPLQILLMLMNSIAFQNTATDWVRDHRLHHKFSDTDADPHNAKRGFFFSHVGWLLTRKHPQVKEKGKLIDMSDIYNNPVLRFQKKYAIPLIGMLCFVLPTVIPIYFWGETLNNAWHLAILRYVSNLNATFLVNSAAHKWGYKPYDKSILSVENLSVSFFTFGEGFHNYHHVFPWDYRAAELGNHSLNFTTKFINFFAWIGWAYDLKTVPEEVIRNRSKRTGNVNLWGTEDEDFTAEYEIETDVTETTAKFDDDPPDIRQEGLEEYKSPEKLQSEKLYLRHKIATKAEVGDMKYLVLLFKLYRKHNLRYRAFCAGTIISETKVLSSSNCLLTNKKVFKPSLKRVKVVGGIIETTAVLAKQEDIGSQQWREIKSIITQKYYRFPMFNLAIVVVKKKFYFNYFVDKIPYASKNFEYDGVCSVLTVKVMASWSLTKEVHQHHMQLIPVHECQDSFLKDVRQFYCTMNNMHTYGFFESEGGGIICHNTTDPKEVDHRVGILVGVTSLINLNLPSLHTRVGLFSKWIKSSGCNTQNMFWVNLLIFYILMLI